jgi:soluble lytic murein transglycosylase
MDLRHAAVLAGALALLSACAITPPPPAATPTPIPTATTLPTTTLAPTATVTPTPVPTPTFDPQALRTRAAQSRHNGDITAAVLDVEAALPSLAADDARQARFELARAQYEAGAPTQAAASLGALISETAAFSPAHPLLATYYVLLGRARESAGDPPAAALGYAEAISAGSVLSPYLHLWLGNYQLALGQAITAVAHYRVAVDGAPSAATEFARRERLAQALLQANQPAAAVVEYEAILARARNARYRAEVLWDAAQARVASADALGARSLFYRIVTEHENTPQALLALRALLADGQQVDELQRGRIEFYNDEYAAARDTFRRAIVLGDGRADEVRMWAARNYVALGAPADALRNLDQILAENPLTVTVGAEAAALAVELRAQGEADAARALAERLAAANAPAEALGRAAAALAGAGYAEDALRLYGAANDPGAAAGLLMQLKRPAEAAPLLARALAAAEPNSAPRLRLALARAQIAAGQVVSGETSLRTLAQEFPDAYEGVRAMRLISPSAAAPNFALPEPDAGRVDAEAWLRTQLGLDAQAPLGALPAAAMADPRFVRGAELLRLGFEPEALDELGALFGGYSGDPRAAYAFALYFRDAGLYRLSIQAADALMRLTPARMPSRLPPFLGRLLYPAYYADLVTEAAREFGLPPGLIFSVMRQESLFEPFAASSASASGLMQIMPATGVEIHGQLNWPPEYAQSDLARPSVSVRFGAHYLARQLKLFDGVVHIALAAYNGGPGNALRWRERGGDAADEFLDAVTYAETRRYITAITVNQEQYGRLYDLADR